MEYILLLIFLSWIVSAIASRNKKKQRQQQQQLKQQAPSPEQWPQATQSSWREAQTRGFGYDAVNPFAEAYQWPAEDAGQTVDESAGAAEYAEGECYDDELHQHDVYAQETKWTPMDELTASGFGSLDSNLMEAPKAGAANKSSEPIVASEPQIQNEKFAFTRGSSEVISGIIWSEILARPQERLARRHARRF